VERAASPWNFRPAASRPAVMRLLLSVTVVDAQPDHAMTLHSTTSDAL
jgi:hypothetical protein